MKKSWFSYIVWLFTAIFVVGTFFLPETVPVHWNMQGVVDRYGSRYEYLFIVYKKQNSNNYSVNNTKLSNNRKIQS